MYTQGFGEVLTDIMTANPALADLPSASAILDTSNYTFQAVTFGKDADGFSKHGHVVYTSESVDENAPSKNLVIFAGQSNMNGFADESNSPDYSEPISGVNYWDLESKSFVNTIIPGVNTYVDGVSRNYVDKKQWGPEVRFARRLVSNNIGDTYLFKLAHDGSYVVNPSSLPSDSYGNGKGTRAITWNPSGGGLLWPGLLLESNNIINELGDISGIKVTFIWNQGETEGLTAQENDEVALTHSSLTSYFLDSVSSIFSGAESFNIIRVQINSGFGVGSEPDFQYYPNGIYNVSTTADPAALASDILRNEYYTTISFGLYPSVYTTSAAGSYGLRSFSSIGEVINQQQALDSNIYGPLISMEDQNISALGFEEPTQAASANVSATTLELIDAGFQGQPSGPGSGTLETNALYNGLLGIVSALPVAGVAYANTNFHYDGAGLNVMGDRLFDSWVSLTNPIVGGSVSSFNNQLLLSRNYSNAQASSYNISATYAQFSSTYRSVPDYPAPNNRRLELETTEVSQASSYDSSPLDLGHYLNAGSKSSPFRLIWNVVGGFPPSGYQDSDFFILSADIPTGTTNILSYLAANPQSVSGELSGAFNSDLVMDKDGYLTFNQLSGIGEALSAAGTAVSGSAFSGGALVFSSTGASPSSGVVNVAVRLKNGDAASLAMFGGLHHLGVWCLDLKQMLAEGLRPPFIWDALDNLRKYKLVSKVTFWDNLLSHKDDGLNSGIEVLSDTESLFTFGGPVFILKYKFT